MLPDGRHRGAGLFCPACGSRSEEFAPGPDGRLDARCPVCQSLERHRFLAYLLAGMVRSLSAGPVLDLAPQTQIRRILEGVAATHPYVGMDRFEPERSIDLLGDITRMPFRSRSFTLIVCYHVLEHVPDDRTAMRELRRVLTRDGVALVQVPHRPTAPTDEDPSAPPAERIQRFGQADHVRYYGRDFEERLAEAGLHAWIVRPADALDDEAVRAMGLNPTETVWACTNEPNGPPMGEWPPRLPSPTQVRDEIDGLLSAAEVTRPHARSVRGALRRLWTSLSSSSR